MTWYSKTAVWWPYNRWPVRRLNCWLKELPVVSFISSPWTRNLWPDLKPSSALWPTCWTQNRYPYRLLFILKSRRRESLSPTMRGNSFSGINGLLQLNLISLFKKYILFLFYIRRHYPVLTVSYCGLDPEDRRWNQRSEETGLPISSK